MNKKIAITYGDPEGIGIEVLNSILQNSFVEILNECNLEVILFGSQELIVLPNELRNRISIRELPKLTDEAGEHSFRYLEAAVESCQGGECKGLVTGPISKQRWAKAGHKWSGQTEFLGSKTSSSPEMLFVTNNQSPWRSLLLTRHIPIKEVAEALTLDRFRKAVSVLKKFLQEKCSLPNPQIALAGLNPHAGEDGEIGNEEKLFWKSWAKELDLKGPFSPDEIWTRSARDYLNDKAQEFDAYLAPYHDQVLPLLKLATNFLAVNVSIGLPFIRTSPDHGTAFDLVGTGKASSQPFLEAIKTCVKLI